MKYAIAVNTDIGSRNGENQDSYLAKTATIPLGEVCMALVCDGMGGLNEGERASQTVVKLFDNWFTTTLKSLSSDNLLDSSVEEVLKKANTILIEYGNRKGIRLGTTASIIIFINNVYYTYHIGDSRIYRYGNKLIQLTQDHTLAASKVRNAQLSIDEAKVSCEKNILLQCVGVNSFMDIHKTQAAFSSNDIFLICTDGLYNKLDNSNILNGLKGLKNVNSMQNSINTFIEIVKNKGETDNITGLIIKITE